MRISNAEEVPRWTYKNDESLKIESMKKIIKNFGIEINRGNPYF